MIGFWGTHVFEVSERTNSPLLDGMRLDSSLEVEQQESTEAQNPLDVKGAAEFRRVDHEQHSCRWFASDYGV